MKSGAKSFEFVRPRLATNVELLTEGSELHLISAWTRVSFSAGSVDLQRLIAIFQGVADDQVGTFTALWPALWKEGLLVDAELPVQGSCIAGVNLVPLVYAALQDCTARELGAQSFLSTLLNGRAGACELRAWLQANFHYTDAAARHILPMLNAVPEELRADWVAFHREESTHWRIYGRAFRELGLDIQQTRMQGPSAAVRAFVEHLEHAARNNPFGYAASLIYTEQAPATRHWEDDPLCRVLVESYGLSVDAMLPLWNHAVYNGLSGHQELGARTLAARQQFSAVEVAAIIATAEDTVKRLAQLYDSIPADACVWEPCGHAVS